MSNNKRTDSSSNIQVEAEVAARNEISKIFGVELKGEEINFGKAKINLDIYSEELNIIGEIYSHTGKAVSSQVNKIRGDILKLLLMDHLKGKNYRKIIIVIDEQMYKQTQGYSWFAEAIRQFNIEVILVNISEDILERIKEAQKKQNLLNKSE